MCVLNWVPVNDVIYSFIDGRGQHMRQHSVPHLTKVMRMWDIEEHQGHKSLPINLTTPISFWLICGF